MSNTFYLKGLDGLRAIASLSVVIGHIELTKYNYKLPNYVSYISEWGSLGVTLFFVLSGFLITTLLQKEKNNKGKINIKNFYLRRILRVWPLYYLILIVSAFALNYSPSYITLLLCGSIFPNIAHGVGAAWIASPQIWSIGVEEQFYLFWPTLLKQRIRIIFIFSLFLVLVFPILPHFFQFVLNKLGASNHTLLSIERIFSVLNFGAMATGALFSLLYFNQNKFFKIIKNKLTPINKFLAILPFLLWFSGINFSFLQSQVYSLLFGYMIILLIEGTFLSIFESSILLFIGKISYGIYMFHWVIMILILNLTQSFIKTNLITGNLILYASIIGLTILTAYLSYNFVESKILRLKNRFH